MNPDSMMGDSVSILPNSLQSLVVSRPELFAPISTDFTVIVDTREQSPFSFSGFLADAKHKRKLPRTSKEDPQQYYTPGLEIRTERGTLRTGDYSIQGLESEICIERKSLSDLYSTLGQGRDRFVRELERMAEFRVADIVIEAGFQFAIQCPPAHSSLAPKSVFRMINAWKQEFRNVHWNWCDSRTLAEHLTFRILDRYWVKKKEAEQKAEAAT